MRLLLDTSVAVALRERDTTTLDRLIAGETTPAISLLTVVELEGGVTGSSEDKVRRRAALDALLDELIILDFDTAVVEAYRQIIGAVGFSRRRVIDRLIAATAIVHGLTLVTVNGSDVRDIPGLKLEVWPAPAQ